MRGLIHGAGNDEGGREAGVVSGGRVRVWVLGGGMGAGRHGGEWGRETRGERTGGRVGRRDGVDGGYVRLVRRTVRGG